MPARLSAVNTPDGRLEVFSVSGGSLTHADSIPVGMEPVAVDYTKLHTDAPDLVDPAQIGHSLATPLQSVVSSDGSKIYMAAFGFASAKVAVFDAVYIEDPNFEINFDPTVQSANYLSTGGGPAGLALDEANNVLYVWTRFDNSVSAINLATGTTTESHALHNPEPKSVVDGRRLLYDAVNTSGNGEASCSSCHIFADSAGAGCGRTHLASAAADRHSTRVCVSISRQPISKTRATSARVDPLWFSYDHGFLMIMVFL